MPGTSRIPSASVRRPGARGYGGRGGGRVPYVEAPPEWRGTTVQVCGLWPFGVGSGTPTIGVPLGRELTGGATLCCDPISWFARAGLVHNPSELVLGKPGLGKSTLVRRQVVGLAGYGVIPLVLGDLKPDYADLIAAMGGQIIKLGRGLGHSTCWIPVRSAPPRPGCPAWLASGCWPTRTVAAQRRRRADHRRARWPRRRTPRRTVLVGGAAGAGRAPPRRADPAGPDPRHRRRPRPGAGGHPGPRQRRTLPAGGRPPARLPPRAAGRAARRCLRPAHHHPDPVGHPGRILHRHLQHRRSRPGACRRRCCWPAGRRVRRDRGRARPGRRPPGAHNDASGWCWTSCGGCCGRARPGRPGRRADPPEQAARRGPGDDHSHHERTARPAPTRPTG